MSPLLQRELVLNRHKVAIATRVRFTAGSSDMAAAELNRLMPHWPKNSTVMVGVQGCALESALLNWRVPSNALLEIPVAQLATPAMRILRSELAAHKVALCLNGEAQFNEPATNFRYQLIDGNHQSASSHQLALGLPDGAAFEAALDAGYGGASGWFFLHPAHHAGAQLNPSHAKIIHLLNLVRNNAEVDEIDAAFKQDVSLAFKLLRYINSAGFGLRTEVGSFRQAVTLMGYNKLNRWLSLLLASAGTDAAAPALMHTALMRAHLMEVLGAPILGKAHTDELFIAGAFSVLEVLLNTRLDTLLQHLKLPATISDALLDGKGAIAPYLQLAIACESAPENELRDQLSALDITSEQCNSAQCQALNFADQLQLD